METEAIFSQIESLVDELRRKKKNINKKKADIKTVTWVLLPISGSEDLICDSCYKDIQRQVMHISITNDSRKVLCEECWKSEEEGIE